MGLTLEVRFHVLRAASYETEPDGRRTLVIREAQFAK